MTIATDTNATYYASPVGQLLLCSNATALTGIYFADRAHAPIRTVALADDTALNAVLTATIQQLDQYFAGTLHTFNLPLAWNGTEFQQRVWQQLLTLNYGSSMTYLELAQRLASPLAVRAVGAAVGQNPISIIVPCHRVQGKNGQLRGYAGGLDRKRWLIEHETQYHQQALFS